MNSRIERLRAKLEQLELDAMVVSRNEDQRYFVGFSGHAPFDSVLFVSPQDVRIVTDFRYLEAAEKVPGSKVMRIERGTYEIGEALRDFCRDNGIRTVGFEAQHVTVAQFKAWQRGARAAGAKLKPTQHLVMQLRAVKDASELELIRRAVQLADDAFADFCAQVHPGMTEKQGAWLIEKYMREHGAQGLAFSSIVASGPNAASPHAEPTDRAFQPGEPITIDIGAYMDEYNSDLTRTITLGHATDEFMRIYKLVLQAQLAVEKKARVGMTGKQVDRIARKVIEKAGMGDHFGHGLGHGVGRVVHEFPRAGKTSQDRIQPGNVLTVEPGIYLSGWGGVRIEDMVEFGEQGLTVLTQASKEPVVAVRE